MKYILQSYSLTLLQGLGHMDNNVIILDPILGLFLGITSLASHERE